MEPGNNAAPNFAPPLPPVEVASQGGETLPSPETGIEQAPEKAQAEIVKNTQTPQQTIVKNTQTDDATATDDTAVVEYDEVVSRGEKINKQTLEVIKRDITGPIREGKLHEADDKYQELRGEQVEAIRKKGTV
jgi:hypothetical protein